MACSHTSTCPLFPLISVNSALKVWKTFYCEGKYENCQRYTLSRSGQSVPANLLPNGKSLDISGMTAAKDELKSAPTGTVAKKVADEMALIDLDLDIGSDTGAPVAKKAPASAPAAAKPAAVAKPVAVAASSASDDASSWYLRIAASTDTGVVGSVIQALGHFRIKIDAMAEKRMNGSQVAMLLIVLTDQTSEANLQAAIGELKALDTVLGDIKCIKLEHLSEDMFK